MPIEQEPVLQNANDVSTIISDIQYPALRSVRQSTGRDRTDDEGTWTDTVNREECDDRMTRGWLADTERRGEYNHHEIEYLINQQSQKYSNLNLSISNSMYDGPPTKRHVCYHSTNK